MIAEVGYRPSATTRALKAGVADTIALLEPRRASRPTPNQLLGPSAAFRAQGWSVPRDLSMVVVVVPGAGPGGPQLPPLTGVDVPVDEMAAGAASGEVR